MTAQAPADFEAAAGSEDAPANPAGPAPDEDKQPVLSWARGAGTPVEASAWLTDTPSPDNAATNASGSMSSGAAGAKPDALPLIPDPRRPAAG